MREEKDSLGALPIPDDAYYGIQTLRAVQNFPISGLTSDAQFIRSYVQLKKACAIANWDLGVLTEELAVPIIRACDELIAGKWSDQFVVDVFQAGAGTSTNMNVNEVIANRALELMDKQRGDYKSLSPNDHVNMSQSTNDTYPTAMRLAGLALFYNKLSPALIKLGEAFREKEKEFSRDVKSGRTHLQDAVPITLGQEFGAWASMMDEHYKRLFLATLDLTTLGIGGSAAGSGLNTPLGYAERVIQVLQKETGVSLTRSKNLFEAMQSLAPFVGVAGALKNLALDILKISHDLRLLSSGPMTGLAEIMLPAVQPGSSIMPGKVNPSILEMISQVALQVVGCEATIAMASQAGQLELNVMMPVVQYNMCFAFEILSNALDVLADKCIRGIEADRERMRHYAESSASIVTALAPHIGYLEAAAVAKQSLKERKTIREIVLSKNLMKKEDLDAALNIDAMTNRENLSDGESNL